MAVFVRVVEDEGATAEILGERRQFARQPGKLLRIEDADLLQALGMRLAGLDVEQEELAVEDHVFAGKEPLDARVDLDAWLLPQQTAHVPASIGIPVNSSKPNARLRFCSACVAAPLSRLSSVATTTRRRPSSDMVKPPSST